VLIAGVVVFVGFLVVMFLTRADDTGRGEASEGSIEKLTSVPVETLDAVGVPPQPSNVNLLPPGTAAVEEGGKPTVTYIGAEYCPFCAVERWPMVVALSQFGEFSGLDSTTSAPPPETLPNTPTVTFAGSTYTSDYITFSSAETQTRDFQPLEELTPTQQELFDTYNVVSVTGSDGAIPWVMMGNLYTWAGSQYDPSVLDGKDFDQIVTELQDPTTDVAKEIGGSANYITAMICQLTNGQPEDVCSRDVIQQAQAALPTA
jgi:thiol-disulfide isomerase/thioredoxin